MSHATVAECASACGALECSAFGCQRIYPPARRVVHWKRDRFDVFIGRGSKWGNPFIIPPSMTRKGSKHEAAARAKVIEDFERWVKQQPHLMASLHELRGKTLGCWCAPKPCHGDVLQRLVDEETERLEREHLGDPEKKTGIYAQL